jgi:membrane protein required for colicin V production
MNPVDIAILLLMVLSAALGFRSGLIQSVFSLVGLIAGIAIASWHYKEFAARLTPYIHSKGADEAIAYCLIAIAVMVAASIIGMLLKKLVHGVGLGWVDRLAGLAFGFARGALLVTLCIVTLAAFFPDTRWLGDAQFAKYFLGSVHLTTQMTPQDLKHRILEGLRVLRKDSPEWLHPD